MMTGSLPPELSRLALYPRLNPERLAQLSRQRVAVVGVGGVGSAFLLSVGRLPLGELLLIDRDILTPENLGHQLIYERGMVEAGMAKAEAAASYLGRVNPSLSVRAVVADLTYQNIGELLSGVDLMVDGLDNFPTRFLINDYAVREGLPWVYGGVVEGEAVAMAIVPGKGACLRCYLREPPPPGTTRTCDVYGVAPQTVMVAGAMVGELALRILLGEDPRPGTLYRFDLERLRIGSVKLPRDPDCPACGRGEFEFLEGRGAEEQVVLCGSEAVQVRLAGELELPPLGERLAQAGLSPLVREKFVMVEPEPGVRITVFYDGRVMQTGSADQAKLRSFVDRYLGR